MLSKSMFLSRDKGLPLLNISFISKEPQLSKDVVEKILSVLQKVMKEFKLEINVEKRIFIETRMNQIKQDLARIEENLKEFRDKIGVY